MMGKPKETTPEPQLHIPVTTIPTDFYAGANPTITFKHVEKVVEANDQGILSPADKKALDKATAVGSGQALHPATVLSNHKKLGLIGAALFGIFVVGAGGYYWWESKQVAPAAVPPPPELSAPVVVPTPATTTVVDLAATTPTTTTDQLAIDEKGAIEFPSILLGKGSDLDQDGLTDKEEDAFKTDPSNPDTDADSHLDGTEVYFLYNPIGKEPEKIIDSGLVAQFTNPTFGYTMYYPASWVTGNVDQDYRDMLFSTIDGENVEVRVFDKDPGQTFPDWFAIWAPDQKYGDLVPFTTRFGDTGVRRSDKLVYYFTTDSHVFVVIYHTPDSIANYTATMEMMARSFVVSGQTFIQIPPENALTSPATEPTSTPAIESVPTTTPIEPIVSPSTSTDTSIDTSTGNDVNTSTSTSVSTTTSPNPSL